MDMDDLIHISVEDEAGGAHQLAIPADVDRSLMDVLRESEYDILASCGGMALCATCHIEVLEGMEHMPPVTDAELDMFDTLADAPDNSRLACQIRMSPALDGLKIRLFGNN